MNRSRLTVAVMAAVASCVVLAGQTPAALGSDALFTITKVWTINLSFAPQAWDTLAPTPTSPGAVRAMTGRLSSEARKSAIQSISSWPALRNSSGVMRRSS